MASITSKSTGYREIQFIGRDRRRRTIRLGKMPLKTAETIKFRVEQLAAALLSGSSPDGDTARWVGDIGDTLHGKLAAVGLVQPREDAVAHRLGTFIDAYIAERTDLKPTTLAILEQTRDRLYSHLGKDRPMGKVTPADADAFRAKLIAAKLAKATVNKRCRYARHFFEVAKRRKLIAENPFGHISGAVKGNPARRMFIPAQTIDKVIAIAPDPQWKLLIALARYGGLRIPSEALALTWGDVDFERCRFTVRASKTEHHEDGGVRVVPMFPELAPLFQAVFDEAEPGTEYVITRYRPPMPNLGTQFRRYILRAGVKPWPKLWQNLRASRATELADLYPSHVCTAWLGHTEKVADEFYRMVTDEHFAKATGMARPPAKPDRAMQNPMQSTAARRCTDTQPEQTPTHDTPENKGNCEGELVGASACNSSEVREWAMGDLNPRPHGCDPCALAS